MSGATTPPEPDETPSTPRLTLRRKLAFAGVALFAFLVVIEGAARLLVSADLVEPAPKSGVREAWAEQGWEVDPLLGWKLLPDNLSHRGGAGCVTNSFGLRGHEIPLAKPPGEFRILSVGDSTALGFAVAEQLTYASVLEELLRSETTRPVEVINAGVPGYTSAQVLLYLEERGLAFSPDAVVVQVNFNDRRAVPPGHVADSRERFESLHSTLRLRESLDRSMTARLMRRLFGLHQEQEHWLDEGRLDYQEIAVDSPARVPLSQYEKNVREIVRLANAHGADVYLIGLPDYPDLVQYVVRAAEAVAEGRWDDAVAELDAEPWFAGSEVYRLIRRRLLNRIALSTGRPEDVQPTSPVNLDWFSTDGYLPISLSGPYIDALTRIGADLEIPVIVPRPGPQEIYHDYIHLNALGHRQVAVDLARAITPSERFKSAGTQRGD